MAQDNERRFIEIAEVFARGRGIKVESYPDRSVKADAKTARVSFHNPQGRPGDHFTVLVDVVESKATDFIPGR